MCGNNGHIYLFNGETGYLVRELVSHQALRVLALCSDAGNQVVWSGGFDNSIACWHALVSEYLSLTTSGLLLYHQTGKLLGTAKGGQKPPRAMEVAGGYLFCGSTERYFSAFVKGTLWPSVRRGAN